MLKKKPEALCRGERYLLRWSTFESGDQLMMPGWTNHEVLGTTPESDAKERGSYHGLKRLWHAELPESMYKEWYASGDIARWCEENRIKVIGKSKKIDTQYRKAHLQKNQLAYFVLSFRGKI